MIFPQFSSVNLHSHNHRRLSWWAGRLAGKPASYYQTKVAVVRGLLGDVDVLPMVVKEGACGQLENYHSSQRGWKFQVRSDQFLSFGRDCLTLEREYRG